MFNKSLKLWILFPKRASNQGKALGSKLLDEQRQAGRERHKITENLRRVHKPFRVTLYSIWLSLNTSSQRREIITGEAKGKVDVKYCTLYASKTHDALTSHHQRFLHCSSCIGQLYAFTGWPNQTRLILWGLWFDSLDLSLGAGDVSVSHLRIFDISLIILIVDSLGFPGSRRRSSTKFDLPNVASSSGSFVVVFWFLFYFILLFSPHHPHHPHRLPTVTC